jgi:hypothetical protein
VGIGETPQPAAGTHDRITVRINSNDQKYQIDRPCQVADGKTPLSHRESGPSGLAGIMGVQIHFLGVWIQSLIHFLGVWIQSLWVSGFGPFFWVSGFSPFFSGCLDSVPFSGCLDSVPDSFSGCLDSVPLGVWIRSLFLGVWIQSLFFWVSGFSPSSAATNADVSLPTLFSARAAMSGSVAQAAS